MTPEHDTLKQYADIRRYKLHLLLSEREMNAFFSSYTPDGHAPHLGCRTKYAADDNLLAHIENAVYDNSILLEDYQTDILLDTDKILFFPPDTEADVIHAAMKRIFNAENCDVHISEDKEVITAFTLCPGLKGFLDRTFAGVEVKCAADVLRREFQKRDGAAFKVYTDLSDGRLTLLAFHEKRFMHGSVHTFTEASDAAYFIYALWHQLGLSADQGEVNVSGPKVMRGELMTILRRRINYVMMTLLPRLEGSETVPTVVLLDT